MISELLQHTFVCIYAQLCFLSWQLLSMSLLLMEHFSSRECLSCFLVQVLYCPQHTFKETVQHQWTQWSDHYHWTSGPRDHFLAQHNCYSHRNKWVRDLRNAGLFTLWTPIMLCMCFLLSGEYILLSAYITVACYTKEHY